MELIKCVVIGAAKSGKRSLIIRYTDSTFSDKHLNSVTNSWVLSKKIRGRPDPVFLGLWDTPGGDELEELQHDKIYPETNVPDVHIICVSLEDCKSEEELQSKVTAMRASVEKSMVPFLLVGTKADLKQGVVEQSGVNKREESGMFIECSALSGEGVGRVFDRAMILGLEHGLRRKREDERQKKSSCVLL